MTENRRHNRYILEHADISCKMVLANEVNLLDISLGGASIVTNKRLNIGGNYTLRILTDSATLRLHGEAVWEKLFSSKKLANGDVEPLFKAGLRFDNILSGKGAEVLELISSTLSPSQIRPRLRGLRIHVDSQSASIDFTEHSRVKEISIGGIVVETTTSLDPESQVVLELLLHDEESHSFVSRVTYCIPSQEKAGIYSIGFEFVNMSPETHTRLFEFISMLNIPLEK